jgi:hypothetical protein
VRETHVRDKNSDLSPEHKPLIVSGCGSTGVNSRELEHMEPNHYALIELLRRPRHSGTEFVRIEWRELSTDLGAEWATRQRWTLRG